MALMKRIVLDSEEELKTRCMKEVYYPGGFHTYRCRRKAVKDGWCKQHHPEAERARREKSDREWKAKWDNSPVMQLKRKEEEMRSLALRLDTARNKLQEAFEYANGRWSEWGSRAEGTVELLEELDRILKGETGE